jgi:hypothetical protein
LIIFALPKEKSQAHVAHLLSGHWLEVTPMTTTACKDGQ